MNIYKNNINKTSPGAMPMLVLFAENRVFVKGDYAIFQPSARSVFSHGISLAFSPKWP